jgi:uncharacterized membrane protein
MDSTERLATAMVSWIIIAAIGFLIATACVDGVGRKSWNHTTPVPPGVVELSADSYLVKAHANVAFASGICRGVETGEARTGTIQDTRETNGGLFIHCTRAQTWNDHRAKSLNFVNSAKKVAKSGIFIGANGLYLLIWVPFIMLAFMHEQGARHRSRKQAKINAESKRKELARAYADGTINDVEFENGLDKIYKIIGRPKDG